MEPLNVCDTKTFYDTEFEAEIEAAKVGWRHGEEFEAYACGNHWHITHKNREQRRGVGHRFWKCPRCRAIVPRKNQLDHKCDIT